MLASYEGERMIDLFTFLLQETINSFTPTFRASGCGKFLLCYFHILLCSHGKWSKLDRWAWWFGWRDCCFCLGCNVYSCSTHMFWWTHTIYEWIFLNFYILNIYVYALFFNSSNFHVSVFGSRYSFDNPTNRNQKYVILHHILPFSSLDKCEHYLKSGIKLSRSQCISDFVVLVHSEKSELMKNGLRNLWELLRAWGEGVKGSNLKGFSVK